MSAPIPCPCCGSDIGPGHEVCTICGTAIGSSRESNAGGSKCARCGAMMPPGYDFCPVCGQDQRLRLRRPPTEQIHIGATGRPSQGGGQAAMNPGQPAHPGGPGYPPSSPSGYPPQGGYAPQGYPPQGYAPQGGQYPPSSPSGYPASQPSAPQFSPPPAPDRTVPAPSSASRPTKVVDRKPHQEQGALIAAIVDAETRQPPAGMPAVQADNTEDSHTVPNPAKRKPQAASDADRTVPHPRIAPRAISPVRAATADATQPDRPGGFSGGPGHGPLPTVNRAKSSTLAPIQPRTTAQQGSVNAPSLGPSGHGPRLVLVARDGSEGEAFPLQAEQMTIGRTHGDLLFPEDPFLSPMHVRLQRTEKGWALFDAGSTNGVYLRIRGSASVYPGDSFMIGHQLLRLENIDTQVQERPPAIDGTRVFGTPLQPAWGCVRQVGRGGIVGDKYYLRGSQVVLGREGGDLLFPNDPFVSREHARLRLELRGQSMAVFLEDLESANGTYCRIRGSAEMVGMDTFRIGDQILRLRVD